MFPQGKTCLLHIVDQYNSCHLKMSTLGVSSKCLPSFPNICNLFFASSLESKRVHFLLLEKVLMWATLPTIIFWQNISHWSTIFPKQHVVINAGGKADFGCRIVNDWEWVDQKRNPCLVESNHKRIFSFVSLILQNLETNECLGFSF